jgi:cytochrome b6-f complex iron-sulfur subunit
MAEKKKMSVEEILAACRRMDGQVGAPQETPTPAGPPAVESGAAAEPPAAAPAAPVTPAAGGKPRGQMSTAEILAAARAGASGGPAAASGSQPVPVQPAPAQSEKSPGKAPAAKPGASKPAGKMSTADILAAARAGKAGAPADAPAEATPPAAAKPAAKPAAAKPAAAKAAGEAPPAKAGAAPSRPRSTASILAAARAAAKPGPISKAEAAARGAQAGKAAAAPQSPSRSAPPMPDKPAYALPRPQARAAAEDRRGFIQGIIAAFSGSALAVGFSSLAVTFNLWTLGLARFMFPNILIEPPTRFKVGFPDELAPGQVQTKFVPQFGVWIVRFEYDGQPQIYALQTVCTHLGCTPNWLEGEQKFKCPCHGSGFYKDGINFEGPAPRPLERFAIRLADDGQLEVDKSRKFKEELGQWKDANSFVPV